jgi:hypothetical protein
LVPLRLPPTKGLELDINHPEEPLAKSLEVETGQIVSEVHFIILKIVVILIGCVKNVPINSYQRLDDLLLMVHHPNVKIVLIQHISLN